MIRTIFDQVTNKLYSYFIMSNKFFKQFIMKCPKDATFHIFTYTSWIYTVYKERYMKNIRTYLRLVCTPRNMSNQALGMKSMSTWKDVERGHWPYWCITPNHMIVPTHRQNLPSANLTTPKSSKWEMESTKNSTRSLWHEKPEREKGEGGGI